MNGKQNKARYEAGFTLIEMLVVVSIIAIMISLTVPAINSMVQSNRRTSAKNLIRSALAQAQAYAAKERKYAGIRFQLDGAGRQYIILVESTRIELENFYPGGNSHPLMTLYTPVPNAQPTAIPTGNVVLNAGESNIDFFIDDDIIEDMELYDATTFCVIFSPSGQLVKKPAQCGPRIDSRIFPVPVISYSNYAVMNDYGESVAATLAPPLDVYYRDTIFTGFGEPTPTEGLPLVGDVIIPSNPGDPRLVKYSQTSLLLFQLKKLEEMSPEERYDYIMYSPESKPLMINIYTGKLIEEE